MQRIGLFSFVLIVLYFCGVLFPSNAHAYLDPGTGAMILQLIGGVIFGAVVTFRLWWSKLIGLSLIKFLIESKTDKSDDQQ